MAGKCGSCTACCRVFAIPQLEKPKPAGVWCEHCAIGDGCRIYENRPSLCVDFACLWLQSQSREDPRERLADELRPDRCKVVITPTTNDSVMSAMLMPGMAGAWRRPAVRKLLDRVVRSGMRVVIGMPSATRKTMLSRGPRGDVVESEAEMTEPDENGMQWNVTP